MMTKRTYIRDQQAKMQTNGRLYKTLKEARAIVRACGNEYTAVRALDLYTRHFIGYTVEIK